MTRAPTRMPIPRYKEMIFMKNELTKRDNYDFFDAAMNDLFPGFYGFNARNVQRYMRTDIKESDEGYTMEVEVPGVDKSDIRLDLKEGYLTISVNKSEKQESGKKENYIHRERSFSCSRSYYVGDISKDEIKAKYENGMLNVFIPKEDKKKAEESHITIE